jgi:hypothetical protein
LKTLPSKLTNVDPTKTHLIDNLSRLFFSFSPELDFVVVCGHLTLYSISTVIAVVTGHPCQYKLTAINDWFK